MKEEQVDTTIEKLPEKNELVQQCFSYDFFQKNRYKISEDGQYEALCNNGFIKLYTKLGRVYWHTQNQFSHEVYDWKFHVSVQHKDLKKSWDLIASIFIKMKCRSGMKTIYMRESQKSQDGRQITLYLIKYDPIFKQSAFAGDFGLGIHIEHSEDFWLEMCKQIEMTLSFYDVESNGLADGDYPLGKYISLRNEGFVRNSIGESIYPPNSSGWNPLKHQLPINLSKFQKIRNQASQRAQKSSSRYHPFGLVGLTILALGLTYLSFEFLKDFKFTPFS